MELRNIRSAHERVLQYLRWGAIEQGRSIAVEGQLQDIAAEIGITREALYRTLAALEAEGHLSRTDAAIILLGKSDSACSKSCGPPSPAYKVTESLTS